MDILYPKRKEQENVPLLIGKHSPLCLLKKNSANQRNTNLVKIAVSIITHSYMISFYTWRLTILGHIVYVTKTDFELLGYYLNF